MKTGYVLRFDDLCPTTNWQIWDRVEDLLDQFGVKPIVSVIPDNRDKALHHGRPSKNFWDRAHPGKGRDGRLACTGISTAI